MGGIIIILIVAAVIYYLVGEGKRKLESAKNTLMGERGRCVDCKYCLKDESGQYSRTGYFCRLSKCEDITEDTVMDCMEKPTVTEEDLKILFDMGIWTTEGQRYIRDNLLGKKMVYAEVDAFLSRLPHEHPEYIRNE